MVAVRLNSESYKMNDPVLGYNNDKNLFLIDSSIYMLNTNNRNYFESQVKETTFFIQENVVANFYQTTSFTKIQLQYNTVTWRDAISQKAAALPLAIFCVFKSAIHLLHSALYLPFNTAYSKVYLYTAIRDGQESLGNIAMVFNYARGRYWIEQANFYKAVYALRGETLPELPSQPVNANGIDHSEVGGVASANGLEQPASPLTLVPLESAPGSNEEEGPANLQPLVVVENGGNLVQAEPQANNNRPETPLQEPEAPTDQVGPLQQAPGSPRTPQQPSSSIIDALTSPRALRVATSVLRVLFDDRRPY